jgi:hypothetical protein
MGAYSGGFMNNSDTLAPMPTLDRLGRPVTYDQPSPEDLANRFTYHPPRPDQPNRYRAIRDQAYEFAKNIRNLCPDSREKSLALTALEETVMWANAAIARNE